LPYERAENKNMAAEAPMELVIHEWDGGFAFGFKDGGTLYVESCGICPRYNRRGDGHIELIWVNTDKKTSVMYTIYTSDGAFLAGEHSYTLFTPKKYPEFVSGLTVSPDFQHARVDVSLGGPQGARPPHLSHQVSLTMAETVLRATQLRKDFRAGVGNRNHAGLTPEEVAEYKRGKR
jgi:hypothetical protein